MICALIPAILMSICNAVMPLRSGYFEVHVAVVIFGARDIGKDGVLVTFHHETHRDTRHRRFHRHARVHHRKCAAADGGHRRRPV